MRIARFFVTPEFLRQVLCLPYGTEIIFAAMAEQQHYVELTIEHPDLQDVELEETEHPPLINPQFRKEGDAVLLINWGQP